MKMRRMDSISLDQTYYTDEGYLVDHPVVTTCGIFEYQNEDGSTRRELRLPEHVFSEKSLKSYKGKPIIITHDAGEVDKSNVRREQIGTIMSEGYQDGESVRCEIIIHDTDALRKCGLKELSLGYSLDAIDEPGEWNGEPYDCIQKNIEINHLALVGEARAGESARLNIDSRDDDYKTLKGGRISMQNQNYDGNRADEERDLTPEEMEAAIALYKAQKAAENVTGGETDGNGPDGDTSPAEPEKEKSPAEKVRENIDRRDAEGGNLSPEDMIAEQKADIQTLLAEIDRMQAANDMGVADGCGEENKDSGENEPGQEKTPQTEKPDGEKGVNMDSVDQMFKDRLDICRMADRLGLNGVENLSITEGRKKIIKAVNPKMNLNGKSDGYINAAYDIAKDSFNERKTTDEQRRKMAENQMRKDAAETCGSDTARKNMIERMKGGNKA